MEAVCKSPLAPGEVISPERRLAYLLVLADDAVEAGYRLSATAFLESIYRLLDEKYAAALPQLAS